MSKDLVIQVNVNPSTAPGPTETRSSTNVVAQQAVERTGAQSQKASQAMNMLARQAYNIAISSVGELTGNSALQRRMQATNQLITLGGLALQNPYLAAAYAVSEVASGAINTAMENRNIGIENDYRRKLKVNTYNNNRR
jgi:uncharacterized protein (UPF0210 family)